jgi:hypothetical protein
MWLSAVDHGVVGGDEVFVAEPDPGCQDRQGTAAVPGLGDHFQVLVTTPLVLALPAARTPDTTVAATPGSARHTRRVRRPETFPHLP